MKKKKKKRKKKKNKPIWPRFSHNPNTEHKTDSNSYKIKLNKNKQIWKKEKRKKKEQVDLTQPDGGKEDEPRWDSGRGSAWWTSISDGMVNADPPVFLLSLCLSLSLFSLMRRANDVAGRFCKRKRNKRREIGDTCLEENEMKE